MGDAYYGDDLDAVRPPNGSVAVWPIRKDGSQGRWRISAQMLRGLISQGHARVGGWRGADTTIYYLKQGESKKVTEGIFKVCGTRPDGSVFSGVGDAYYGDDLDAVRPPNGSVAVWPIRKDG
ncbi:hypothetical protein D9B85_14295, partial [Corynebacterium diphtheriae]